MKNLINSFKQKNLACGWMYFYIHFVTEIICFYFMMRVTGDDSYIWLLYLIYDFLAFVPQSIIGKISDKHLALIWGFWELFL